MPMNPTPLFSASSVDLTSIDAHSIDSKARTDYERSRQMALKGHDHQRKKKTSPTAGGTGRRQALALASHGHSPSWRNSVVTPDDMDDLCDATADAELDDVRDGKENSKPSPLLVSVSLEDLLLRSSPKKQPRKSVSRSSLSRQASLDRIHTSVRGLSLTQPSMPSISESSRREATPSLDLLSPMTFSSSDNESDSDFDCELSSPGAEDWTMDTELGCLRFKPAADHPTSSFIDAILVEKCDW
ncbi:hypothetical protein FRB99_000561 [Tulasnella sp. 403]|nr:hypothetical protein FRB99_000561 [Tulasnella sp. 403]